MARNTRPAGALTLPRLMGHRGAAAHAPENTLAGFRAAAGLGLGWVEFDVMLSGDGVPVLFHDDSLKRITGRDAMMAETPAAALGGLDAGAWFGPAFKGEALPTLERALEVLVELGLRPNMEIKPTPGRDVETAVAALDVLARRWPAAHPPPLVSSFSRACLGEALRRAPDLPRGYLVRRPPRDWAAAAGDLRCSAVHVLWRWLSAELAGRIKAAGYGLASFTVNDPGVARRLRARGVDCLISDAPDRLQDPA